MGLCTGRAVCRVTQSPKTLAALPQGQERWVMEALQRYVADEAHNKLDAELDTSDWPVECATPA